MRPTATNLQRGSRFAIVIENWDNAFDMENTYGITFNDVSTLKPDESNIWSREPGFPMTGEVTTGVWTHVRGSWDLTKSDTNKLPTTNQNCIREGQLTGTQRPGPALFRAHTKSDDAFSHTIRLRLPARPPHKKKEGIGSRASATAEVVLTYLVAFFPSRRSSSVNPLCSALFPLLDPAPLFTTAPIRIF